MIGISYEGCAIAMALQNFSNGISLLGNRAPTEGTLEKITLISLVTQEGKDTATCL